MPFASPAHEAVAVPPSRIIWIVAQKAMPQTVGHRRGIHRCVGLAGLCLLNRVDGKRANGIDAKLVELCRLHHSLFKLAIAPNQGVGRTVML